MRVPQLNPPMVEHVHNVQAQDSSVPSAPVAEPAQRGGGAQDSSVPFAPTAEPILSAPMREPRIIEKVRPGGVNDTYVPVVQVDDVSKQGLKFRVPRAPGLLQSIEASTVLWIPDALAEAIARHSNAYARVQKRSSRNDKSLADPDIRAGEILTFLGIYYYMGVVRLPARRDYWVVDPKWPKHPLTGKMTRGRFDYIWRNLHLVAPDDEDVAETTSAEKADEEVDGGDDRIDIEICRVQHDMESEESDDQDSDDSFMFNVTENVWFSKVSPLVDHVRSTSLKVIACHSKWLSLDEQMVRFRGRSIETYRMKNKPIGEGYKFFVLSDAATGFVIWFCPDARVSKSNEYDCAAGKKTLSMIGELVDKGLGERAKGSVLVMDNYFTQPKVQAILRERGIAVIGTARGRPGWPPKELTPAGPGEIFNDLRWCVDDQGTLVMRWLDNGDVLLVSTCHYPTQLVTVVRRKPRITVSNRPFIDAVWGKEFEVPIKIPRVVNDYNFHMNGVDKVDQLISYYVADLKFLRTWMPMAFQCFNIIRVNAWIMFKRVGSGEPGTHKDFIMHFALALLNRGEEMDQIVGNAGKKRKVPEVEKPSISLPAPTGNARGRSRYRLSTKKPCVPHLGRSTNHVLGRTDKRNQCVWCNYDFALARFEGREAAAGLKHPPRRHTFCFACDYYICVQCYRKTHAGIASIAK